MKWKIFIPFVNNQYLLNEAIESLRFKGEENILLIDNSVKNDLGSEYEDIRVYIPEVPLYFNQTMTLMNKMAIKEELDFFIFMHSDASARRDCIDRLFSKTQEALENGGKWSVMFTYYDTLASFCVEAVKDVGNWDNHLLQYFADNDYYRRCRLKGWPTLEAGGDGVKHLGGATWKTEFQRQRANAILYPAFAKLYEEMWGGVADHETYDKPFNKIEL